MIPELGQFALVLSAVIALFLGTVPLAGTLRHQVVWQSLARPAALLQFVLVSFSFACLASSFLSNDFSVKYVAEHSNTLLPKAYQFAAVWGGHEGSLLLWVLMLSGWTAAVAIFSASLPLAMVARVLGVLGLVSVGFLMFILTTSNPFDRLFPMPADGRDLNPLLQDPGLVIHPPMLYMGYVGMSVTFAFSIAALLSGRLDAAWARWSRPWTVIAWAFLTFGIGWGGWWFWDPVENASLMPWLVGTALIHSLMVTEKRGSFKAWTVLLAIAAFSLSLLGTFLVRSGVLTSVHAFASDPSRGIFILIFLAVVVGASLTLFAWRAPAVTLGGTMGLVSRESFLLLNSVLLVVATGAVLLGTLYPLIIDALNMGKLSVGPPYFNLVFAPLMVPLLFVLVPGTVAHWREARMSEVFWRLRFVGGAALLLAIVLPFVLGSWSAGTMLGVFLGMWVGLGSLQHVVERLSKPGRIGGSFWGMHLAHFGMAVLVLGITGVKSYEVERDVRMAMGDTVTISPYTFRLVGMEDVMGPNYKALQAKVEVLKNDQVIEILYPQKRRYFSSAMPMTEAAIDTGPLRDLYVSLGDPVVGDTPSWSMRVYYKPFVPWLWAGVLFMVFGGMLAALDRRYRRNTNQQSVRTASEALSGSA
jgi:cytochrome c-type biogenesis protein CcmF